MKRSLTTLALSIKEAMNTKPPATGALSPHDQGALEDEGPDPDLPSVHPRPPTNWMPKKKVLNWLAGAVDSEWSADDRKKVVEKFQAAEE